MRLARLLDAERLRAWALATVSALLAAMVLPTAAVHADWHSDWETPPGFSLEIDAGGFTLPTSITFVPRPGPNPDDPLYFVTELAGSIKVVTNDRSVHTFARDFFKRDLPYEVPDMRGEFGLVSVALSPEHGYVFASFAYTDSDFGLRNDIVRFQSEPHRFSLSASEPMSVTEIFSSYPSSRAHQIGQLAIRGETLFVGVGDALISAAGHDRNTILGKILAMDLDGRPKRDNPFNNADGVVEASDYVWAEGFRNPFGLALLGEELFVTENGPIVDRFVRVERGLDHGFDGSDWSMGLHALAVFAPAVSPVQIAWLGAQSGLLRPQDREAFYLAFSGSTQTAPGPGRHGEKSVVGLHYDRAAGRVTGAPEPMLRYRGSEKQMPVGVAFGPDALYVVPLLAVVGSESAVLKLRYDPSNAHPFVFGDQPSPETLLYDKDCLGCHESIDGSGRVGPSLDPRDLVGRVRQRIESGDYLRRLDEIDELSTEPYVSQTAARESIRRARGKEKVRLWLEHRLREPRFDTVVSMMPTPDLTAAESRALADYFIENGWTDQGAPSLIAHINAMLPRLRYRYLVVVLLVGIVVGALAAIGLHRES